MERLHVAADRADRQRVADAARCACHAVPRTRAGQRDDDGRLGNHRAARARAISGLAEVLHRRPPAREREGVRPGWASPLPLRRWRPRFLRYWVALVLCVASIVPLPVAATDVTPSHVLDRFEDPSLWQVTASDDVKARLGPAAGSAGRGLCLEFDFGAVSGYAVVRRELKLEYAENYEFSFAIRGDAPPNTLQFKLLDA